MTGCQDARRLMDARIDGEIGPAEIVELEYHLRECAACRDVSTGLETVASGLLRLPLENMPDEDLEAVLARTVGDGRGRRRVILAAAAAVLAAAFLIPLALRHATSSEPSASEIARASKDARMVLTLASRAVRSAETAASDRVIHREVSPALRRVPVRWSRIPSPRRSGA